MKRIKGTTRVSPTWWSEILTKYGDVIPQAALSSVRAARVPQPPLLPDTDDRVRLATLVGRGYFAACMEAYGSCRAIRSPDAEGVKTSGHMLVLAEAAPLLREHRLPPAAWSAFSIFVWREYVVGGRGGAWNSIPSQRRGPRVGSQPRPAWVFSHKRIEQRQGWFDWDRSKYAGGRMIFTPALTRLVKLQGDLRHELLLAFAAGALSEERVRTVVESTLPRASYTKLVDQANDEAEEYMDKIERRIKRGEWVW